jgi:hypothetical protein
MSNPTASAADAQKVTPDVAGLVDGAFVVVVATRSGRYRRRVWLSLAPAQRAAAKAREDGIQATVIVAELRPLYAAEPLKGDQL